MKTKPTDRASGPLPATCIHDPTPGIAPWVEGRRRLWSCFLGGFLFAALTGAALPALASPAPAVSLSAVYDGQLLRLRWSPAGDGAAYTVEAASSLSFPDWEPLGSAAAWPISATEWSGPLPNPGPGFFRLRIAFAAARGDVESSVLLRQFSQAEMAGLLQTRNVPGVAAHAVDAWKIVYATIDARGRPTRASMLAAIPQSVARSLPLLSYQHGTITLREDVPSRLNSEADLGLIMATSGFLAVLPDYIGLGDSPGLHPYHHAKSEATAVVDALRALRRFAEANGVPLNGQLFLTGYSQGGHATLAAQREIELLHADEFVITASAPAAGAYDLSGIAVADFLSNRIPPNPYYSAYLLMAMTDVYDTLPAIGSVLRPPYNTTIPPLFDGQHDGGTINAAMLPRPADIVDPAFLDAFRDNPAHPMRLALADNDLHRGWVPRVPTRLYHCAGDLDVLPTNSDVAFETFKAAGATTVERKDPLSFANHTFCIPFALLDIKGWFESLRLTGP